MEVYLIRHPKPVVEQGICYGQSDLAVSEDRHNDVIRKINKFIPDISGFIIYSSDLKRCRKVAENLITKNEVIYSPEIRELNFGKWEMKPWNEIPSEELKRWMDDFVNVSCNGGECYKDLYNRTVKFWNGLKKQKHRKAVLITHGGVIRSILAHILQIPLKNSFSLKIDYGSITKISIEDGTVKTRYINR